MLFAIFLQCLLAISVLSTPIIQRDILPLMSRTDWSRERETRIKKGFRNIQLMAKEYLEFEEKFPDRKSILDEVFLKYFLGSDKERVQSVMKKLVDEKKKPLRIVTGTADQGNQKKCDDPYVKTALIAKGSDESQMMICTRNDPFEMGDISTNAYPGTLVYRTFGATVVPQMKPLGGAFLDSIIHWNALIGEEIHDYMTGPYAVTKILDKKHAIHNADSYAWLLVEAYWTMKKSGQLHIKSGPVYHDAVYNPNYDVVFENPDTDELTYPFSVVFDGENNFAQKLQIRSGFQDIRLISDLIHDTVEQAAKDEAKYHLLMHVYNKYFADDNFVKIMSIFARVQYSAEALGRSHTIRVEGKAYNAAGKARCSDRTDVFLFNDAAKSLHPRLLVCPSENIFSMPSLSSLKCSDFEGKVSQKMRPLGFYHLRELMRWEPFAQDMSASVKDSVRGPYAVTHIDKGEALLNAESYAWFATEAYWTLKCGYVFQNADYDNEYDYRTA